ncbi:AraC family transcriptional regulator [Sphaerisporangium krabiense]|uniref:AraC family transcriptional activator FtrA n=1 Tax=Sphaerisporangium krabiense TaxID=763782 RepID=A0A7W8YZ27_9ACTN|nr:helix-turn-helix domain-containing protein [Sphaerisporangium krabiense]MBB5624447.1 AraC family transcriptional activator FtrA [Sphaerisporangium krabiense]GII61596.1 AraC family transcriptional regulator [Sphaerisporangium krabiense]
MHRIAALVRPPQSTFELACVAQVFGIERPGLPTRYAFGVCAERPGPVATHAGYDMLVTDGLDALDRADTVVVPGWLPAEDPPSPAVVRALRRAHARGARVVSICSGAFALAHAGLLDGREATTHWALADDLAARFPRVRVDPGVLYVDHGDVATSAGAGAGFDLCVHLLRGDQGAGYAAHVARTMVMPPHREGGQLQYSAPPHPAQIDGTLAPLLEWATRRLGEPLTIETLAAHAGVSARTLARRFADQLGTSPGQWLLAQRIATARDLLESSDLPLEAVARRAGLSSATNLRRRFLNTLGTTPGAYRRAFRAEPRPA